MKNICLVDFDMSVTGGVEQVTTSLANALCDAGEYRIFVYAINSNEGDIAYELDERVQYSYGLKGESRLRKMIVKTFYPFCAFVKKNKIDVVLLMGNYPALIVSPTRIATKAKYVYCDHGALMNQWHQKDITAIRFLDTLFSHKVVVLTERTRRDYVEKFHIKKKNVACIYNWISPDVQAMKKPYCQESRKILTVGRFGKEKGYDMLVEMAREILPKHPDWQWHVYGTGETFEEIAQKVEAYGLTKQLILKGNVQDAYKLYGDYAFYVLPSYREGLPIVLLEAMACGLPMISFDVMTGPSEIIEHNKNGFLIPPYDCEEMMCKMEKLMDDEQLRVTFSSETSKGLEKFGYACILNQWMEFIESL